eukprot:1196059-Prorocentrum_minimum.AAC.2
MFSDHFPDRILAALKKAIAQEQGQQATEIAPEPQHVENSPVRQESFLYAQRSLRDDNGHPNGTSLTKVDVVVK